MWVWIRESKESLPRLEYFYLLAGSFETKPRRIAFKLLRVNGTILMMKRALIVGLLLIAAAAAPPLAHQVHRARGVARMSLKVGDIAPDFTLLTNEWKTVKLSDYRGKKNVFLAVYVLA